MRFEPMTSCLLDRRSNQLSYGASSKKKNFQIFNKFDGVWPSCWSVIFPIVCMVSYTLGTRGSLSAACFRDKLKSGRQGRPNQWKSLCENTFSFVLILMFYLTGIFEIFCKVSLQLLHKILLKHPEENHQVIQRRENKQKMRFIKAIFG